MENVGMILETCFDTLTLIFYLKDGKPHQARNFKLKENYKGDGTLLRDGAYILKVDHKRNKTSSEGPTDQTRICQTDKIEK